MISILCQRNFGLLWLGQVISVAGDWVLFASLAFYVYALTGSVLASGVMMIMSTVPRVVLGSVAGVFVGIPIAAMVVSFNALIQSEAPDEYRGRMFGAFGAAAEIATLAGMAVSTALAGRVGIVTMLNVACVAIVVGAAVGGVALAARPSGRAAM